jgi:hypothetical protein
MLRRIRNANRPASMHRPLRIFRLRFQAPPPAAGSGIRFFRSDIFSLGIVCRQHGEFAVDSNCAKCVPNWPLDGNAEVHIYFRLSCKLQYCFGISGPTVDP